MFRPLVPRACIGIGAAIVSLSLVATASTVTLHNFAGGTNDGAYPNGALIADSAGNLYGTTWSGGSGSCTGGCGTVFRLSQSNGTWTESIVHNFQGMSAGDGTNPWGALTADASGNFYGVTEAGGARNQGSVYELSPGLDGAWTETVLYSFGQVAGDGSAPGGKLIFDSSGNLWGTTSVGGSHSTGTIFELKLSGSGWSLTSIYSFPHSGTSLGEGPAGIVFDSAGNLFGVTEWGGTPYENGAGVVFQMVNSGGVWNQKVLHRFPTTGKPLQTPTGGLYLDSSDNLYMTMSRGGHGGPGITTINLSTFAVHDIYSSAGPQEVQPYEAIAIDTAGNLYSAGYASSQGTCACGFVYELSPGASWTPKTLASMNGNNGANPVGGVVVDAAGNLYGVTYLGGTNRLGVVYEVEQ